MIVTENNIKDIPISDKDKNLLNALLQDLGEINHNLPLYMFDICIDYGKEIIH